MRKLKLDKLALLCVYHLASEHINSMATIVNMFYGIMGKCCIAMVCLL